MILRPRNLRPQGWGWVQPELYPHKSPCRWDRAWAILGIGSRQSDQKNSPSMGPLLPSDMVPVEVRFQGRKRLFAKIPL